MSKSKRKKITSYGCSFTFGEGLDDSKKSYPYELGRLLDDEFDIVSNNFIEAKLPTPPLPNLPSVNPANFNTEVMNQGAIGTTGLTSTEQALLSPEEQAIRLRQRGQA